MTASAATVPLDSAAVRDPHLQRRLTAALEQARELLGLDPGDAAPHPPEEELALLSAELQARIGAGGRRAVEVLAEQQHDHEEHLARLRERSSERAEALARVGAAIGRLREISSPDAMLAAAARELCESSELDRALLSRVRDGAMVAESAWFRDDPDGAARALEALRSRPVRLEHPLLETEVLRRRRATVVADADVHPRAARAMTEVMGWRQYVAAPIVVGSAPIAILHADRRSGPIEVLHRDVLWELTSGLAQAHESATLRRTLRAEREQMRHFVEWLEAQSTELGEGALQLIAREPRPLPATGGQSGPLTRMGRDDTAVFRGVLTARELDVMRLVAQGRSNRGIAGELVIADGTVKFHVNSILRKLQVTNRAEAVARYYALLGVHGRG